MRSSRCGPFSVGWMFTFGENAFLGVLVSASGSRFNKKVEVLEFASKGSVPILFYGVERSRLSQKLCGKICQACAGPAFGKTRRSHHLCLRRSFMSSCRRWCFLLYFWATVKTRLGASSRCSSPCCFSLVLLFGFSIVFVCLVAVFFGSVAVFFDFVMEFVMDGMV